MKEKLRIFFSDRSNQLAVVIALALAQMLFFNPITIYKRESAYLYQNWCSFHPMGSGIDSCHFYVAPHEDLEIIAFSDIGYVGSYADGRNRFEMTNTYHTTYQKMLADTGHPNRIQMLLTVPYEMLLHDPEYMKEMGLTNATNLEATEDLVSYTGFLFKKHGRIVGAELYKMYGTEGTMAMIVKPVVIMEYPIISAGVSEFAVRQKLQEIALIDRIITLNSATEIPLGDPYWDNWHPRPRPNVES